MKTIEELIFETRFPGEEFNPDDYNDWVSENPREAYNACLSVARELQDTVNVYEGLASILCEKGQ